MRILFLCLSAAQAQGQHFICETLNKFQLLSVYKSRAASTIIFGMGSMYLPYWFWGWRNRFYSIEGFGTVM